MKKILLNLYLLPVIAVAAENININSDSMELLYEQKMANFKGNVKVKIDEAELGANEISVSYKNELLTGGSPGESKDKIKNIIARGNVRIKNGKDSAKSDAAFYDAEKDKIKLSGNVTIIKDDNKIKTESFVYDLAH